MKILYIGCVTSSFEFLKSVFQNTKAEIVGVVTKKVSNFNADHHSLHVFCDENNVDWIDYVNNQQLVQYIKSKKPDAIYCFGWSYLLPKEVYSQPKLGAVGYHPTLLPKNRGRHPIIWTIALGLKETGSTFFKITDIPDAGDILSQKSLQLDDGETANSLYEKLIQIGKEQVVLLTNKIMDGSLIPIPQDEVKATYLRKRKKKDGLIDWRMNAQTIINLIKALSKPYLGAHFEYEGKEIKIWVAEIIEDEYIEHIIPGEIVEVKDGYFIVKTSDKLLKVTDFEGDFKPVQFTYL